MENKKENFIIRQFFSLLRAGLGKEPADCRLFSVPDLVDWKCLFRKAEEQAVIALVWDGMLTLPAELHPDKSLFYKWLAKVIAIEKNNEKINTVLPRILETITRLDIPVVVLKGQGTAALYPNPLHRQCGDIDLFTGANEQRLQEVLIHHGFKSTGHRNRKHSEYTFAGFAVENHYCIEEFYYPPHRRAFHRIVSSWYPSDIRTRQINAHRIPLPPPWFEALLGVAHFGKHLLCSGVGLRHLVDWAIIISTHSATMDKQRFRLALKELGLANLAAAMAELSVHYLGCRKKEFVFLRQTSPKAQIRAQLLLEDMWKVGNFGQYAPNQSAGKSIKSTFCFLYGKARRNYVFWPFYRMEALFLPFVRAFNRLN